MHTLLSNAFQVLGHEALSGLPPPPRKDVHRYCYARYLFGCTITTSRRKSMKPSRVLPKRMLFRVSVRDVVPEIWRKLLVSSEITLAGLHSVLQVLMGWEDRHLYAFVIDAKRYASPNDTDENLENQDKIRMKLSRLFKTGAKTITYEYDFGDRWQIVLTAEPIDEGHRPSQVPECIGGSRHGLVEDSGGSRGYMEKALIYRNPKHRRYLEVQKLIGPNFNPEAFDLTETNARLKEIA